MGVKKKVRSLRVDPVLDDRIASYARARGISEAMPFATCLRRVWRASRSTCSPRPWAS